MHQESVTVVFFRFRSTEMIKCKHMNIWAGGKSKSILKFHIFVGELWLRREPCVPGSKTNLQNSLTLDKESYHQPTGSTAEGHLLACCQGRGTGRAGTRSRRGAPLLAVKSCYVEKIIIMSTVVWYVAIQGDRSKNLVIFGFNKDDTEQITRRDPIINKQRLLNSIWDENKVINLWQSRFPIPQSWLKFSAATDVFDNAANL